MTSENNDKSLSRRHFIISASTIALAGCSSIGGDNSDLPPPNYEENPNTDDNSDGTDGDNTEDSTDDPSDDQNSTDESELTQEEQTFFSDYQTAHANTETAITQLTQALDFLNNREFEQADTMITNAQLTLENSRQIISRDRSGSEPQIWNLVDAMDRKTELDLLTILGDLERAIALTHSVARLTRDANVARDNGNVETYQKQRGEARLKLSNAEFYLPQNTTSLRYAYIEDISESSEESG